MALAGGLRGLGALGLDAGQTGGGGFVIRALGGRGGGEGFFQDGQAQGVGAGDRALRETAELATPDAALLAPAFEASVRRLAA